MPGFAAQCCRSGSCAAQFPSPSFHASLTLDGCRRAQEPPAAYYRKQKGAEPSQPPRVLPGEGGGERSDECVHRWTDSVDCAEHFAAEPRSRDVAEVKDDEGAPSKRAAGRRQS
jgi:hypothetical protein